MQSHPVQPTQIHPKVAAATIGGAVAAIIIWAASQFGHVDIPGEVGAAIAAVCSFAFGYLKSSN